MRRRASRTPDERTARAGMTPQASAPRLPRRPDGCPPVPSSRPRSHAPSRPAPARFPTEPPSATARSQASAVGAQGLRPRAGRSEGAKAAPRGEPPAPAREEVPLAQAAQQARVRDRAPARAARPGPAEPGSSAGRATDRGIPADPRPSERRDRRTGRSARRRRSGRLGRLPGPRPPLRHEAPRTSRDGRASRRAPARSAARASCHRPARFPRTSPWHRPEPGRACPSASRSRCRGAVPEPWGSARRSRRTGARGPARATTMPAQWRVRRAPRR